jgi:hypothetical protein
LARGKSDSSFEREEHIEPAEFFRIGNGVNSFEMENRLAAMILAEPAGLHDVSPRLGITAAEKNFAELRQALGEIREELYGDFALVATGTKNVRDDNPAWSFRTQM